MDIELINTFIKMFSINNFIFWICLKIIDYKNFKFLNFLYTMSISTLLAIIYIILKNYINTIFIIILGCFGQVITLSIIIRSNKYSLTIPVLTSNAIAFGAFIASSVIEAIPRYAFQIANTTINFVAIILIEWILLVKLFKIKRIRNGLDFLKENAQNDYFNMIMINFSTIIILAYCTFRKYHGVESIRHDMITFTTLTILMIVIIQKTLTMYYKQKLLDNTIKQYEKEIKEKDVKIEELANERFRISKINHEFFNRQEALELKVKELESMKMETAEELEVTNRIQSLTNEYSNLMQSIKSMPSLPKSDISEIDDMFKYMQAECYKNNIDFKIQINGNIHHLINNLITKSKLETLIGDHIRDAIIAVTSSDNKNKSIFAILGLRDDCYEFCVYDTGIDFEIDTLIKLGVETVTTHKETGGSGIGFITTFETMKECNASLIIEEKPKNSKNYYTKSVTIRFDGKNEYRIISYRANEIKKQTKDNRIIIEEI